MTEQTRCTCPPIDGYVIVRNGCPHHQRQTTETVEPPTPPRNPEADEMACAWADYRKDYGISGTHAAAAYLAFVAGWQAARRGDQSGVLR